MSDKYYIAVWDITFYKTDEFGNPLTDNKGNVQLYQAPDCECSYLTEGLTDDDLVDIKP